MQTDERMLCFIVALLLLLLLHSIAFHIHMWLSVCSKPLKESYSIPNKCMIRCQIGTEYVNLVFIHLYTMRTHIRSSLLFCFYSLHFCLSVFFISCLPFFRCHRCSLNKRKNDDRTERMNERTDGRTGKRNRFPKRHCEWRKRAMRETKTTIKIGLLKCFVKTRSDRPSKNWLRHFGCVTHNVCERVWLAGEMLCACTCEFSLLVSTSTNIFHIRWVDTFCAHSLHRYEKDLSILITWTVLIV